MTNRKIENELNDEEFVIEVEDLDALELDVEPIAGPRPQGLVAPSFDDYELPMRKIHEKLAPIIPIRPVLPKNPRSHLPAPSFDDVDFND